ncbi:MAG: DUF5591 domain-containing protein [Candidatus Heimdallarchaeota archaeon]|nr:DUF5591 domain-containing protein [Candidatus Heimdallarchaeota archaeon]MBY8992994.1 DUF5591 domain-containing protein [Candidatus Heimdallarchaeota archaeon]
MKFQLSASVGFAKLAKLRTENMVVEIPTIMSVIEKESNLFWKIGDGNNNFTMGLPTSSLNHQISKLGKEDLTFVGNILMHSSLNPALIKKQLIKTKELMAKSLEQIPQGKATILIQPTDSQDILQQVLQMVNELEIKNIAITNMLPLLNNQRQAVNFLAGTSSTLTVDSLLYLLSPVPHTYWPILAYAGISVFNDGFADIASKQSLYLTDFGGDVLDSISEKTCFCEACNSVDQVSELLLPGSKNIERNLLEKHNKWITAKKIREIRSALRNLDLRSYVEQMIHSNVFSGAALRLLDKHHVDSIISKTPTWKTSLIKHITEYSYYRPEIQEFQRRIRERYRIQKGKKIVVIFPCSARKPYSQSKSHEKFIRTLDSISNKKRGFIQEIILTSPLGVIPRELEIVYPAAHYDIPVTGDWSHEETEIVVGQLTYVLSKAKSSDLSVVAHVSNEYIDLCKEAEKRLKMKFKYTATDEKATSSSSLSVLFEELNSILMELEPISYKPNVELARTIADYQFGLDLGEQMFKDNCRIRSKPNQPMFIMQDKKQIGVIHPETGKLTLTIDTGKILAEHEKYFVLFDGMELEGSTLFSVGVVDADPQIRPTDSVIILNKKKELIGVGNALISGKDMKETKRGPAVKIKQKV